MNNKYLEHVLVMLKQVQQKIEANFGQLSEEQLNWKPDEKTWSIAEIIDHLNVTTKLYYSVFDDIKNNTLKTNFWMKIPFWKKLVTNALIRVVDPETKRKTTTSPPFEPTKSSYTAEIVNEFAKTQSQLIIYIHELDGYDHANIVVASPLNAAFVYNLSDTFTILWKHQVRHLNQAKTLMSRDEFPTT
jgi:hypothetical protein